MARVLEIKAGLKNISAEIGSDVVDDFLASMDRDYFVLYSPAEIADHLRMAAELDEGRRVAVKIVPKEKESFEVTIVAFDAFSEFAILCGLLASFGLDIQAGHVHTWRGRRSRAKIIDLFRVRPAKESAFDLKIQEQFKEALTLLIGELIEGRFAEARKRINQRLIQYQADKMERNAPRLAPIEVRFDNRESPQWTRLEIEGRDTPGFLYAFSNALALRNVYIHKVSIENVGSQVRDRFYISDRRGKKFLDEKERKALKISALLIKQFTSFLNHAPDPAQAIHAFDQFLDKIMEVGASRSLIAFLKKEETLAMLARLFGASEFLWEDFLRAEFENLLPILGRFKEKELPSGREAFLRPLRSALAGLKTFEEKKEELNRFKDRELFRIDLWRLLHFSENLTPFSAALTDLAQAVLEGAHQICGAFLRERHGAPAQADGRPAPFSICGLGKFGGRELGYASDLEVLFVYGEGGETDGPEVIGNQSYFEKLSQLILQSIESKQEGIFQIDTRLRPYGTRGSLATSLERFAEYYSETGGAAPFERQALIKLRSVGGDPKLGREIETRRDRFVYSEVPWDLAGALELRERQRQELVPPGKINVKYSAGGLLDIEYAAQYLQIMHGGRHPELRTPHTLEALSRLLRLKIITRVSWKGLHEAYLFLRGVIDALRIVRGHSKDLILPDPGSERFTFLARRMGYAQRDWEKGEKKFSEELARHMAEASGIFRELFEAKSR